MSSSKTVRFVDPHHGGQLPVEPTKLRHFRPVIRLSQPLRTSKYKILKDNQVEGQNRRSLAHRTVSSASTLNEAGQNDDQSQKLVIVMVGLPARGKSYITKKLCRYLNWLQYDTRVFNVGDRRRKLGQIPAAIPSGYSIRELAGTATASNDHGAEFFDPDNKDAKLLREGAALSTLEELLDYLLGDGGCVAIFDATNSTVERRDLIIQKIRARGPDLGVMFLESQCCDRILLESNMRLKLSGPDFEGKDPTSSLQDFKERVAMYEKAYVPLGASEECNGYAYCQMIDVGRKFINYNISGHLATQAVHYLHHFNLFPRQIWLTRHGESYDDAAGRIGGDSDLTALGIKYATALTSFIDGRKKAWELSQGGRDGQYIASCDSGLRRSDTATQVPKNFQIWTSMMQRSMQTAQFFSKPNYHTKNLRTLDELNAGILEGLTREEVKAFYTDWYEKRQTDKFRHRYPGTAGEGYLDVTHRLKSVILDVESATDHILLISGLAVTRVLMAYFMGLRRDEIVSLYIPIGTLHMLEPKPYGVDHQVYRYNPGTEWFDLCE